MNEPNKCAVCHAGTYVQIVPASGPDVDELRRTKMLDAFGLESRKAGSGSQHLEVRRCDGCGHVAIFHHGR